MNINGIIRLFAFSTIVLASTACTTLGPNLVENGQTSVETADSKKVSIVKVKINQKEDAAVVRGLVVRDSSKRFAKGFVTVDLYNEQGTRIDSVEAKVVYKRRGSKSSRVGSFTADLEESPPEHSKVIVHVEDKRQKRESSDEGTMSIM